MKHVLPDYLKEYNREVWSKHIDSLKDTIKAEASPGVPCAMQGKRNDLYLQSMGERFNDLVLDRVELMLLTSPAELESMSRRQRIDAGFMDPVRVFVKNEPHKALKVQQGRFRLIMSVSLIDKMIEMLLTRHLYKLEILNWRRIPSKPGIGFTDEDNALVYEDIISSGLKMDASDMGGWDWSVKEWMIKDEAENVVKLCVNPNLHWAHLVRAKAELECKTIFQFSDGVMVEPTYPGIVNSGKLKTSRGNSWKRVRLADLVGSRKTIAAGDDCVESHVEGALEKYTAFGVSLKEYVPVDGKFEFCSRIYSSCGSFPINAEKMIMNLLHQEPKSSLEFRMTMIGFQDELSNHPDYEDILRLVEEVGYFEVEGPHYLCENTPTQNEFQ